MKILLLEDDHILSETLFLFLTKEGYSVDTALSVKEAETLSYENSYDLYLFDINLPESSGLTLLKHLRYAEDFTPTILITALQDMHTMSLGFDLGAIDYIKKPFDPEELLIRLRAKFKKQCYQYKDIIYDEHAKTLRKKGILVDMGNVPYCIFVKLITHIGEVIDKDDLYRCLDHPSASALRVAITKIKQRLNIDIINIRGKGYLIEEV